MTTMTHTHEELATKKDVDERFDRLEERLAESDYKHTQNYAQLSNSFVSMLNVMTRSDRASGEVGGESACDD